MNRGCAHARGVRAGPARSPVPEERERENKQSLESPIIHGGPIGRGALLAPQTLGEKKRKRERERERERVDARAAGESRKHSLSPVPPTANTVDFFGILMLYPPCGRPQTRMPDKVVETA